jgi:histidyl-tRNA synthetase
LAIISIPKGTKDVLPSESHVWQYLENILRKTASDFGFSEIRFPSFEHTELFLRGVGETTDIVTKEMYTFEDRGGRSITLRPEGTASVVRSVVENGLYAQTLPLKVYYIAPVFRYEKPQAGRLREHHQFGVEYFGSKSPAADAEVIGLADTFLKRLGIKNIRVSINSIGCPVCRKEYHAALKAYYSGHMDELCPTCHARFEKNPLRLLDCKEERCAGIAKNAPETLDYLCPECKAHFEGLKAELTALGVNYKIDTRIVRGLDYYTKTVFEFVADNIGAQSTVCGGGRYDRLVSELGGPELPGLGFGSGLERLLMVMDALGVEIPGRRLPDVFLAMAGGEAEEYVSALCFKLRASGVYAERDTTGRSLKAQMKYADKLGAKATLIIGANELANNAAVLKSMRGGRETLAELSAEDIAAKLPGINGEEMVL